MEPVNSSLSEFTGNLVETDPMGSIRFAILGFRQSAVSLKKLVELFQIFFAVRV